MYYALKCIFKADYVKPYAFTPIQLSLDMSVTFPTSQEPPHLHCLSIALSAMTRARSYILVKTHATESLSKRANDVYFDSTAGVLDADGPAVPLLWASSLSSPGPLGDFCFSILSQIAQLPQCISVSVILLGVHIVRPHRPRTCTVQ